MTLALLHNAACGGWHLQRQQNFTLHPNGNYSSPGQLNFDYRGMQQQLTNASRRNVNQRLDDTDHICLAFDICA